MERDRHASVVAAYYDANTVPFYLDRWHPEDIHFGLFGDGADPRDHHEAVKRMTRSIVAPASIASGQRVVDAGCGVGGASVDIARDSAAAVLGLTISSVQVDVATRRAAQAGLGHLARFEVADCSSRLPLDTASVDVVVTIEAACHFLDKPNFLRECARVLRPGGRLAGSDWMAGDGVDARDYDEFLRPVCDTWRLAGLASPRQWRRMLEDAGFVVEQCEDYGDDVLPNAEILAHARLDLMLEMANGCHSDGGAELWMRQYDSLVRAWNARRFTIGRWLALRP